MVIITKLAELYAELLERGEDLPPFGHAVQSITGAICIDDRGDVVGVLDLRCERSGRHVPSKFIVPSPPKRTSAIAPGFLCDTSGYLLGIDRGCETRRSREQRLASQYLHQRLLGHVAHRTARAVLGFFEIASARLAGLEQSHPELMAGRLVFSHAGSAETYAHEIPELRQAWTRHLASTMLTQPHGQCLATGEGNVPIARIHPAIKGVRGSLSTGSALVSANLSAFTSYGKKQCLNAPVAADTAFSYVSALNYLLSDVAKHRVYLGDVSIVAWTSRPSTAEAVVRWLFLGHSLDHQDPTVRPLWVELMALSNVRTCSGLARDADRDAEYCVLAMTPNGARAAVRIWVNESIGSLADRLEEYCHDLAMESDQDRPRLPPSLPRLVQELARKAAADRPVPARVQEEERIGRIYIGLVHAVARGLPFSRILLQTLIDRFRDDRSVTGMRIALVKAIITRQRRHEGRAEDVPMRLDDSKTGPYRVGRLLALLEQVQLASRPAGRGRPRQPGEPRLAERFIASLARRPSSHLPQLLQQHLVHMRRLRYSRPALATWFERRIDEVLRTIGTGELCRSYSLEDQGMVYLGYYHQRSARKEPSETDTPQDLKIVDGGS